MGKTTNPSQLDYKIFYKYHFSYPLLYLVTHLWNISDLAPSVKSFKGLFMYIVLVHISTHDNDVFVMCVHLQEHAKTPVKLATFFMGLFSMLFNLLEPPCGSWAMHVCKSTSSLWGPSVIIGPQPLTRFVLAPYMASKRRLN
jgi:hypothetical protein